MYSVPATIDSQRLLLRRFRAADLIPFTRLMTTPEVTRCLSFPDEMKTQKGAEQLLETTLQAYDSSEPLFALAVEEKASHAFVGCCGVNPLEEQTVEIFYAVMPDHWGKGIATEIGQALVSAGTRVPLQALIDDLRLRCARNGGPAPRGTGSAAYQRSSFDS